MSLTITGNAADFDPTVPFTETAPADVDPLNVASIEDNGTAPKTGLQAEANAIEYIRQNALPGYPIFGDGSDGSHTLDGAATVLGMVPAANVYTATRDLFFQGLTVNTGVSLFMAGFRLYVNGTLTTLGTASIHCNGKIGVLGSGGAGGDDSGAFGAGNGGNGGNVAAGDDSPFYAVGMVGKAGGNGGAGAGGAGGAGTAIPTYQTYWGAVRVPATMTTGILFGRAIVTPAPLAGGTGGGGGGGDGVSAKGGGGGGAGGVLLICARSTNLSGTSSLAVNGGAGQGTSAAGCGGGGGGGAGAIVFVTHVTPAGSIPSAITSFLGGAAGVAVGGGGAVSGVAGSNGSNTNNLYLAQI